ncbi:hypothetical protein PQX77_018775 [Marasmius sp. AFHP31]|nr:hypothetical protein PQX77_018775 [Marasmius sp. AFHP31]
MSTNAFTRFGIINPTGVILAIPYAAERPLATHHHHRDLPSLLAQEFSRWNDGEVISIIVWDDPRHNRAVSSDRGELAVH